MTESRRDTILPAIIIHAQVCILASEIALDEGRQYGTDQKGANEENVGVQVTVRFNNGRGAKGEDDAKDLPM